MSHPTNPRAATASRRPGLVFGAWFGLALFAGLCASARSQDPVMARMVARDATALLRHADAHVRGEAALLAAASQERQRVDAILPLVADPDAACRHRALLALGVLGTATGVEALAGCLGDGSPRADSDAVVAAFALGIAPEETASAARSRQFAALVQGSWKRQHDRVLALLLGMSLRNDRQDAAALRRLLADDSNRSPEVRALLWHLLLPIESQLPVADLARVLGRGSPQEQAAVLRFLAHDDRGLDTTLVPPLEHLAVHGTSAERALALTGLARTHHPRAPELARAALRSDDGREAAAAVAALLALGGARSRESLANRLLTTPEPVAFAAMLDAYQAPLTVALADRCATVAGDATAPIAARTSAAIALARHDAARAQSLLLAVFATADGDSAARVARSLLVHGIAAPTLARLFDGNLSVAAAPERWLALLRAGHLEARRALLQKLADDTLTTAERTAVLTVWRHGEVLGAPPAILAPLPAALQPLFAPAGQR